MNKVFHGDCINHMADLPEKSVDLLFADPPFNIGMTYDGYKDKMKREDYLLWASQWLEKAINLLKPTGSLFVASGDEYVAEMKVLCDNFGLHLRNWIIWHYTFGTACTGKFNRSHTHILYFVKNTKEFTFNAEAIAVPSARQMVYADKRANAKGKIPDATWILRPQEDPRVLTGNDATWYYPRLCGTFKERLDHPCQMPESVLERIIKVASNEGDLVFDPFAGSGTTLAVAKKLKRQFGGVELSKKYHNLIKKRLARIR